MTDARHDLLMGMYEDFRAHARHAEVLRSAAVNVTIVAASVLVAVIANDSHIRRGDLPMCLAVLIIGLFGLAFTVVYNELHERNHRRAMRIREEIDTRYFADGPTIADMLAEVDNRHQTTSLHHSRRILGSSQRFWLAMPVLIVIAGLVLTIIAV